MVLGDLVELVAVDQQVTPPIGRQVFVVALDADAAEHRPDVLARRFVVIAGHEHHLDAMAGALEDLLHYRVLRLDQCTPRRRGGAQVHVREEDRAHALCHGAARYRGHMTGS